MQQTEFIHLTHEEFFLQKITREEIVLQKKLHVRKNIVKNFFTAYAGHTGMAYN